MAKLAIEKTEQHLPARRLIRIAQATNGIWLLTDSAGKLGGQFLTARAALRFARFENVTDLICVDGLLSLFDA